MAVGGKRAGAAPELAGYGWLMGSPFLFLLMLFLLGLLALSLDLRRRPGAVAPMRKVEAETRRLAKRNPERFAPMLAQSLTVLAAELLETGRPRQGLSTAMQAVDLYRALSQLHPGRYDREMEQALSLEDTLKTAAGFEPGMDIHALAAAEAAAEAPVPLHQRPWKVRVEVFYWRTALAIWVLSVSAFALVGLFNTF